MGYKEQLITKAAAKPSTVVLYGPAGIGKSSFGAAHPDPWFIVDRGEDGINTLKLSGCVKADIPVFPVALAWEDVLAQVEWVSQEGECKTLVIDTIGGLERLCAEHVCRTQFRNQWGEKGFGGFGRGWEACVPEWRRLINALEMCRANRGIQVLLLAHSTIKMFKNPEGDDYDRYQPDVHHKIWSVTSKWVDMVLFANFFVQIEQEGMRKKGKGGQLRYMYPVGCAAYEAKNRHGLLGDISMGSSGEEAYANFVAAVTAARKEAKK